MLQNIGIITQIIEPVIDISFPPNKMPKIYNSLIVQIVDEKVKKNNL